MKQMCFLASCQRSCAERREDSTSKQQHLFDVGSPEASARQVKTDSSPDED